MAGLPQGATLDSKSAGLPPGAVIDGASTNVDTSTDDGPWKPSPRDNVPDRLKLMAGVADLAVMGASSGLAEIISGLSGLTALALTADNDWAVQQAERAHNFIAIGPFTDGGKYIMSSLAPNLSKAEVAVTDFSEKRATDEVTGEIDVGAATAIKTSILASVDIIAAVIPGAKAIISGARLRKMQRQVIAEAERLGIEIHLIDFVDDVADAAKLVGSTSSGEAAMGYVQALRDAEYLAKLKKNSLYASALDEKLFVSTSPVRRMAAELTRELDGPYDLDGPKMSSVRRTLDDMRGGTLGFGSESLAVHFSKFEMLRQRINYRIKDAKPKAKSALIHIRDKMDDFMTVEFNKAVMENGRVISKGGALSGDTKGYLAYLDARKANTEFAWFSDTKVIADLIKKDTSVDQFAQWLIGASAVSKKGSAAVVNKMKVMLGEDHPAIAAIRADFIYELTEPLLQLEPNFKQFANNFDKVLRKNKPLADALGLQKSDVAALAAYAHVAKNLPAVGEFYTLREIIQTVSRLGVGHGIAKGGVRVTFMTKVLNYAGRIEKVTKKEIIAAMVDVRFDGPIIPKGTPVYSAFIAGAALTGIEDKEN